jgi:hypothetical protein
MNEATDAKFSLNAHTLRAGLLDIVDDEWMNDRLPDDGARRARPQIRNALFQDLCPTKGALN